MVQELVDKIEELFSKKPDGRKKKDYEEWKNELNPLIKKLNKIVKFKMYDEL